MTSSSRSNSIGRRIAPMAFAILLVLFALGSLALGGCGKEGDNRAGEIRYTLERAATDTTSNTFQLEVDGEFKPAFSLGGTGYTAGIPLDTVTAFQNRTALTAETFGEVKIQLTLYQENGKPYLTDTLVWKSSGEVPPLPKPYFSEIASADSYVYLVLPASRGPNVKEVWVEGDLDGASAIGSYYAIPTDDQVLLKLSEGDGVKNLHVKYRNIYGAHSVAVEASIERKGQGPVHCQAIPVATKTSSGSIRTRIQAENAGPLFYKVVGDVAVERDYVSFEGQIEEYIGLSPLEGRKNLVVRMKDLAGNACDDIKLSIDFDRNYVPGSLNVLDNKLWTDDPSITVLPRFDYLQGDLVEMLISGGVAAGASTFQWIPYAESVTVDLSPTNGNRYIAIQFRRNGTILAEVATAVFLRPFVLVNGTSPSQQIVPGHILGATALTITGCVEAYASVPYAETFPCTRAASSVSVTYQLKDGTALTRSAPL